MPSTSRRIRGFKDHRSACARDMKRAKEESKHQIFRRMLKAAIKAGFEAAWVLGDAWFGCKENIVVALECGLPRDLPNEAGQHALPD